MIDSRDISVVIQGPIEWTLDPDSGQGVTIALHRNVRKLLPASEVILSTWEGQKLDDLDYDQLVLSKDPGPQGSWPSFVPNNVNRQIISTVAGLKAAERKYCLKIRSDMILKSADFLAYYEKVQPLKADSRNVFSRPVVTNNLSSRNTSEILKRLSNHPLPFHPSDHACFGVTEDVLMLWDVPLQSDKDSFHFLDRSQPNRFRLTELSKLTPEQYILTSAISKTLNIDIRHYADMRDEILALSEFYLRTHIISVPDRLFSLHFPKYHNDDHFHFEWMRRNPDPQLLRAFQRAPGTAAPERKPLRQRLRIITYPLRQPKKFKQWLSKCLRRLTNKMSYIKLF